MFSNFILQALFNIENSENGRRLYPQQINGIEPRDKPHTLVEYAIDHFRLVYTNFNYTYF